MLKTAVRGKGAETSVGRYMTQMKFHYRVFCFKRAHSLFHPMNSDSGRKPQPHPRTTERGGKKGLSRIRIELYPEFMLLLSSVFKTTRILHNISARNTRSDPKTGFPPQANSTRARNPLSEPGLPSVAPLFPQATLRGVFAPNGPRYLPAPSSHQPRLPS